MKPVDDLMIKCPLKHEIRVTFWEPFIRKLKKNPITYLTLYSPPLMDVKYFFHKGLIEVNDGVFTNVVGVGIDAESEAESNAQVNYRLDLLLHGDINELLDESTKTKKKAQLIEKFPFDVINLDYVDTLHRKNLNVELSPHINALETILSKQKNSEINQFVLFITTCVNVDHYNDILLSLLKENFDENIKNTRGFLTTLQDVCNCSTSEEYKAMNPNNYFALSLVKTLLLQLKEYNFTIEDADIRWLIRDAYKQPIEKNLLHLAFHVKKFNPTKATSIKMIGKRLNNVEHYAVGLIKLDYETLRVSTDWDTLSAKHKDQIERIYNLNFEIIIPEIKE